MIIIVMLVLIWFISILAANIVPVAIFLILAIMMALIVKNMIALGRELGIIRGTTGVTREIGREGLGLYRSARSEFRQRRK